MKASFASEFDQKIDGKGRVSVPAEYRRIIEADLALWHWGLANFHPENIAAELQGAQAALHRWLAAVGVRSCGRYGAWIYNSMEDSIIQGMEAAAWAEA